MKRILLVLVLGLILLSGCLQDTDKSSNSQLPNPAAVYCIEQGGESEIRTNKDGSQTGYCIFDSSECPQWDFYRGECEQ